MNYDGTQNTDSRKWTNQNGNKIKFNMSLIMSLPLQGRYIVFPMSVRQNISNLIHICTSTLRYIVPTCTCNKMYLCLLHNCSQMQVWTTLP